MKIDVITIFPELFTNFINHSIIKKAIDKNFLSINTHNLRDYSHSKHKTIDDTPYGGGAGMLIQFPPLYDALKKLKTKESKVIILTPQGKKYDQKCAQKFSKFKHLIIICGRYEGFDDRIFNFVDYEVSIGDYILMGGEIPAMALIESVSRLIDNVIDIKSVTTDTFENNLLKYPEYTKPYQYKGYKVPDILLSGHHENIKKWRLDESIKKTKQRRKDLYKKYVKECKHD